MWRRTMAYFFTPPTYTLKPARGGALLSRYSFPYAYSVIKRGALYETVVSPSVDLFNDPDIDFIYQGGHVYPITSTEAGLLTAAGYNPTQE
jgi:hypothetical protein